MNKEVKEALEKLPVKPILVKHRVNIGEFNVGVRNTLCGLPVPDFAILSTDTIDMLDENGAIPCIQCVNNQEGTYVIQYLKESRRKTERGGQGQ